MSLSALKDSSILNVENPFTYRLASLLELKQSMASGRSWSPWSTSVRKDFFAVEVLSHRNTFWRVKTFSLQLVELTKTDPNVQPAFCSQPLIVFKTKFKEISSESKTCPSYSVVMIWRKNLKANPFFELSERFTCIQNGESCLRNGMLTWRFSRCQSRSSLLVLFNLFAFRINWQSIRTMKDLLWVQSC